jgi:hypothetical protein
MTSSKLRIFFLMLFLAMALTSLIVAVYAPGGNSDVFTKPLNGSSQYLKIKDDEKVSKVTVYDKNGNQVITHSFSGDKKEEEWTVGGLNSGMYPLRIEVVDKAGNTDHWKDKSDGTTTGPYKTSDWDEYPGIPPHTNDPLPVGGIVIPVDKFGLLAPYIGLASTAMIGVVATVVYVRRAKRREEKQ